MRRTFGHYCLYKDSLFRHLRHKHNTQIQIHDNLFVFTLTTIVDESNTVPKG